jgi:hypothetical protein
MDNDNYIVENSREAPANKFLIIPDPDSDWGWLVINMKIGTIHPTIIYWWWSFFELPQASFFNFVVTVSNWAHKWCGIPYFIRE